MLMLYFQDRFYLFVRFPLHTIHPFTLCARLHVLHHLHDVCNPTYVCTRCVCVSCVREHTRVLHARARPAHYLHTDLCLRNLFANARAHTHTHEAEWPCRLGDAHRRVPPPSHAHTTPIPCEPRRHPTRTKCSAWKWSEERTPIPDMEQCCTESRPHSGEW